MYTVKDCNFYGVKWEGDGIKTLLNLSEAIIKMIDLFSSQNVEIYSLLKLGDDNGNSEK